MTTSATSAVSAPSIAPTTSGRGTRSAALRRLLDDLVAERYHCVRRPPVRPPHDPATARAELLAALGDEESTQP